MCGLLTKLLVQVVCLLVVKCVLARLLVVKDAEFY